MIDAVTHRLRARAATLLSTMENGLGRIVQLWLLLVLLASAARIATSPIDGAVAPESWLAFLLLAAAPVASGLMAMRWFATPARPTPSDGPLWRNLTAAEARRHPLYGAGGLMVSLLGGLLLNILLRAMEYLTAMPALSGKVPHWLAALQLALAADVVLFSALYAVAFVAALRRAPVFPRLLMGIWAADLAMQALVRNVVLGQPDVPPNVAAALGLMIDGNINKVLISVALWLPYLLLSTRVNVTYRQRLAR